jgi:predicted ester cyclase
MTDVITGGSTEVAKDVVRRFYAAFAANDTDTLRQLLAPELHVYHQGSSTAQDQAAHLATIAGWNAAFSDTHFHIEEQIAEGDVVASRVTMNAVHDRGPFQGKEPSGVALSVPAVSVERVRDGQLVERRVLSDSLGMLKQLGAVPHLG